MLTSKSITRLQKTILNFQGERIAAKHLFQVDLDQRWNYLWCWSWAQCGGGHGGRVPHFCRRGGRICHVLTLFSL